MQRGSSRAFIEPEDRSKLNCHYSLPWFSFSYRDDPLSRLRRDAYARESARNPKSPRRRFMRTLSWPLKAAKQAWRATSRWAAEARAQGAPPRLVQWASIWWLSVRHNLNYQIYYLHKLWRQRPGIAASDWMDAWDSYLIYDLFTAPDGISTLNDKLEFDAFCARHDLPRLPVLAVVSGSHGIDWQQDHQELPAADLFVKPAGGSLGLGAMCFVYDERTKRWKDEGRDLDQEELLETICHQANGGDLLVQQRALNHPEIAAVSPDALSTLRCVTYRFRDEPAGHFHSAMHMARSGFIVDHGIHGAVFASVDDQGFLRGVRDRHLDGSLEKHPDTGAAIAGRRLPGYREMKDLALRAHDALGVSGLIGWDIALLPTGPVLVEGNSKANLGFTQLAMDHPLGQSEYVPIVARLADESASREMQPGSKAC